MRIKTFLIAGCMSLFAVSAFAQENVVWWDFLSGGDGVRMKALIERFNNEHENIKINATTLEWGVPYYTKVKTGVAVGEIPDVMTYHLSRYTLGIQEGVLDEITDEDLTQGGIGKERPPPPVMMASSMVCRLISMPWSCFTIKTGWKDHAFWMQMAR